VFIMRVLTGLLVGVLGHDGCPLTSQGSRPPPEDPARDAQRGGPPGSRPASADEVVAGPQGHLPNCGWLLTSRPGFEEIWQSAAPRMNHRSWTTSRKREENSSRT